MSPSAPETPRPSAGLTLLLAVACGLIAANVYYAQPIVGPISASIGLSPGAAGLIMTMTQAGYGAGLLLVAPLGDLYENRGLTLAVLGVAVVALLGAAAAPHAAMFLPAALLVGLGSVAVQVLVPFAAHLVPEATRGRMIGNVMSGLMLGIMLAWPVASVITSVASWRLVFAGSAVVMTGLALVLRRALPRRRPPPGLGYGPLLASMGRLAWRTPELQRRAVYHACLFGTFSLFWTTVPLVLTGPFQVSSNGVALFAFAGIAGAVAAPIAGRLADRGYGRPATGTAMIAVALSLGLARLAHPGTGAGLVLLIAAALLLNFAVTANFVLGQRALFALDAEVRGRLNGLYMAAFFAGGALCSALGGLTYATGGWPRTTAVGLALPLLALVIFLTEPRDRADASR